MAKVKVDKGLCIGCGTCVSMCEDCFELSDDMKSQVKGTCTADCCNLKEVLEACPVAAITLDN
ncbi:MAG: ferredoxin [Patescibacteria group bacterium]|nr:ferredoxin [Patescibacteria group bacterium]